MSAECYVHGCDIVYPEGTWPTGVCPECRHESQINEALNVIADLIPLVPLHDPDYRSAVARGQHVLSKHNRLSLETPREDA